MKLPVASDLRSRDGDTGQDQRLLNAYVDIKRGIQFVNKRPSLEAALELPEGTGSFSTLGQALYVWQEVDVDSTNLTTSVVGIRGDRGKKTPDTKALLYFTTQPSNGSRNTAISPSIVVTARDKFGNTKTDFTGNVTLSFATNRYSATLSGTLTVAAVAGVATFSNVQINRSGIGFALRATATGAKPATSNTFDIPTALVFTTQPPNVEPLEVFTVVVTSRDTAGNADTNYTGDVAIRINTGNGTLSGTVVQAAVAGVATFTGLSIDSAGTYTLIAFADPISQVYPPAQVISNPFMAATYAIEISSVNDQGFDSVINYGSSLDVEATINGNLDESFTGDVTISLGSNPGGATLSGTTTVSAVDGIASFSDLSINNRAQGYTLVASSTGYDPSTSNTFDVNYYDLLAAESGGSFGVFTTTNGETQYMIPRDCAGTTIYSLFSGGGTTSFSLVGSQAQSVFTTIYINEIGLSSASADMFIPGIVTTWIWNTQLISSTGNYSVRFD